MAKRTSTPQTLDQDAAHSTTQEDNTVRGSLERLSATVCRIRTQCNESLTALGEGEPEPDDKVRAAGIPSVIQGLEDDLGEVELLVTGIAKLL